VGAADKYAAEYYPQECRDPSEPHPCEYRPYDGAGGRYCREMLTKEIKFIGRLEVEAVPEFMSGGLKVVTKV